MQVFVTGATDSVVGVRGLELGNVGLARQCAP